MQQDLKNPSPQTPESKPFVDEDLFLPPYVEGNVNLGDFQPQQVHDVDSDLFEELKKKHRQTEWKWLHWIKLIAMGVVAVVATAVVLVYFLHLLLPDTWCWLSENRLEVLKNSAISIATGLVVGIALSMLHEV